MPKTSKQPTTAEFSPEEEAELAKEETAANAAVSDETTPPEGGAGEEKTPTSESAPEETETPSKGKDTTPETLNKDGEELSDEEIAHLSEKAQKRFRKLSEKAKTADELLTENQFLKANRPQRVVPPTTPVTPGKSVSPTGRLPWETPQDGAPKEITQEELDQEISTKAQEQAKGLVNKTIQNFERLNVLRQDIWYVEQEFPELYAGEVDPATNQVTKPNPDFDGKLADSIVNWYKQLSAANPDLRFLVFARQVMSLRNESAEKAKGQISQTVAKQAAKQALTPTGTPAGKTGDEGLISMINAASSEKELAEAEKHLPHADR